MNNQQREAMRKAEEKSRRAMLEQERKAIAELALDDKIRNEAVRLIVHLRDAAFQVFPISRGQELMRCLNYEDAEQFCGDVISLMMYAGALLLFDLGSQKKKPRRKRAKASPDSSAGSETKSR